MKGDGVAEETKPAAELGNAGAMYDVGLFHKDGNGVPKSAKLARDWLRRARQCAVAMGRIS